MRQRALVALTCAAFAGEASAAAGRVDFATGGATVSGRDGQPRPLARGAELDSGDTVRTNAGRAQIRFTDGSYVSLQPNTDFAISDYRYDGKTDGSERGFYSLVKGAMRTVTGAIGRVNRNAYRVATPTATVGIRGTGGVIQVLSDGSTLVIGTSGIWSLTNPAGSIDVPAGVSGLASAEPGSPPRETTTQPQTTTTPLPQKGELAKGEQVDEDGNADITSAQTLSPPPPPPVLASGPGFAVATAFLLSGTARNEQGGNTDAIFDAAGQLTQFSVNGRTFTLDAGGSHAEFGTDGVLAWGRWIGNVLLPQQLGEAAGPIPANYSANQGLHYVVGAPTPAMPVAGSATYSLMGATSPTYASGSAAPGTFSGSLGINFANQQVSGSFNVAIDGKGYAWNGSATVSQSRFLMLNDFGTVTGSGGACSSNECRATVAGFFAGANAERAGIGYTVRELLPGVITPRDLAGAAAFSRNP
jgi:hypothetical protein